MDLFDGILPFVQVARTGSFSRAAEALGVTKAAVSKAVARLEAGLGAPLFLRTSRQVALTEEGALFLERCRAAVDHLTAGRDLLAQKNAAPEGVLKVSLSPVLGRWVVSRLPLLRMRHPKLSFRISVTDRLSRLPEEGVDVALRIGDLEDSALVGPTIARPRWSTVASPAYLARALNGRPQPKRPADLEALDCLAFITPANAPKPWRFLARRGSAKTVRFTPRGPLSLDNGELLVEAAVAGAGAVQVFDYLVAEHLRAGRLVELLPELAADGPPIRALCLPARRQTPKVRAFLDFAQELFSQATATTTATAPATATAAPAASARIARRPRPTASPPATRRAG